MHAVSSLAALCLVLAATACAATPDVTAGEYDNGGHVEVEVGDVFDVVIPDDYETTLCQWHDEATNEWAILRLLGAQYEPHRSLPGHSGSGTYTGRYEAVDRGTVTVTLSQEDNANPPHVVGRYVVDVTVT